MKAFVSCIMNRARSFSARSMNTFAVEEGRFFAYFFFFFFGFMRFKTQRKYAAA